MKTVWSIIHKRIFALAVFLISSCAWADTFRFPKPEYDPIDSGDDVAVFAGGCFWGVEGVFEELKGVKEAVSGYSGGTLKNPDYDQVTTGATGHAESVKINYDASVISYGTLLKVFFSIAHDPTQLNYQGPDHGTQYRSAIFYTSERQMKTAKRYIGQLEKNRIFKGKIVTEVKPLKEFYAAEEYHQDFMKTNPNNSYILYWDKPKIEKLKKTYPELVSNKNRSADVWYGYDVYDDEDGLSVPIVKSEQEWKKLLDGNSFRILRKAGTEPAYSGKLDKEHRVGTYYSRATGQPLFRSEAKFDSGTGWPSFSKPVSRDSVILIRDMSYGMSRIEVVDSSSGSHLGHVFNDGPEKSSRFPEGTGLRFCMNSASMIFAADGEKKPDIVKEYLDAFEK